MLQLDAQFVSDPAPVPILVYHRIGVPPADALHPDTYVHPRAFDRQLRILRLLGYRTISATDYARRRSGDSCSLPAKPILITFDDGSSTVYSEALPALRRHGFTATLFMVAARMGRSAVWEGEAEDAAHRQLTPIELRALRSEGWDIGSHSMTHAHMMGLDAAQRERELTESKAEIEAELGETLDWFAYPYGAYDPALRDAVARAGYRMAFATEEGDGDALSIPRRIIGGRAGTLKFLRRLHQACSLARK
jgi:peptidoglycan/xylan/chitin deacetylase (PgdA/CDA1 family)